MFYNNNMYNFLKRFQYILTNTIKSLQCFYLFALDTEKQFSYITKK